MSSGTKDVLFYEKIFADHYHALVGYVRRYVSDESISKDIVQDVFLLIWKNREVIDFETRPIAPYLYRSAYNRCLNHIQSEKRKTSIDGDEADIDLLLIEKVMEHNALDTLMLKDAKAEIMKCIAGLPDRCREVFEYSRFEHKKNKEIAELLAISEKTVEKHMTTALTIIRKYMYEIHLLP